MKRIRLRPANKKVEELAAVPLFDHVPRRVLEVIAANVDEVRVEAGQTLIRGRATFSGQPACSTASRRWAP